MSTSLIYWSIFCFTGKAGYWEREPPRTPWASAMETRASQICLADRASAMQTVPLLWSKRASTIKHNFYKHWFLCVMKNFNIFFWRRGIRILLKISYLLYARIRNIFGLIKWFISFTLKLQTFLLQKGRYSKKYFWSKNLSLFCCNLWFKQFSRFHLNCKNRYRLNQRL